MKRFQNEIVIHKFLNFELQMVNLPSKKEFLYAYETVSLRDELSCIFYVENWQGFDLIPCEIDLQNFGFQGVFEGIVCLDLRPNLDHHFIAIKLIHFFLPLKSLFLHISP